MPSSNIETVAPNDGRTETRYFLLTSIVVILAALVALWSKHTVAPDKNPPLPNQLTHFATELSNKAEELTLLEESELLTEPYLLEKLELPTFKATRFQQIEADCFLLNEHGIAFKLEKHPQAWVAQWTLSTPDLDCHSLVTWHPLTN